MDIQLLLDEIQDRLESLGEVESNVEGKISDLEELRDRTNDAVSSLSTHHDTLINLQDTITEVNDIVSDAENLDVV